MADVNLNGVNAQYITLKKKAGTTVNVGDFIAITSNFEACPVASKTDIIGKCVNMRNDIATVQISGLMTAEADGSESVGRGYGSFGVDASGKLVTVAGCRKILVVSYDGATGMVTFIL